MSRLWVSLPGVSKFEQVYLVGARGVREPPDISFSPSRGRGINISCSKDHSQGL